MVRRESAFSFGVRPKLNLFIFVFFLSTALMAANETRDSNVQETGRSQAAGDYPGNLLNPLRFWKMKSARSPAEKTHQN